MPEVGVIRWFAPSNLLVRPERPRGCLTPICPIVGGCCRMSAGVVDSRLLRSYCRCISNAVAKLQHSHCGSRIFCRKNQRFLKKKSTLLGKESTTSGKVVKFSQVSESTFSVHILLHFQLLTPDSWHLDILISAFFLREKFYYYILL